MVGNRSPTYYAPLLRLISIRRHVYMVVSEIVTLFFYVASMAFLPEYFGKGVFSH